MAKDNVKEKDDEEQDAPEQPANNAAPEEADDSEAEAPTQDAVVPPDQPAAAPAVAVAAPVAAAAPKAQAPQPYGGTTPALPVPPPVVPDTPQQEAANLLHHNLQFGDDAKNGLIQPKTYNDLYNEKSLPGKIGTIFGLMLSGAGAGLTHQPNALLAMMDKQIQNDFEAQKTNQTNKQNWYSAALQQQKQDPEIQFQLLKNMKAGVPGAAEKLAEGTALNNARGGAVGIIQQNLINKMPEGPQKIAAQQLLNSQIAPYMAKQAENTATNAVGQSNALAAMNQKKISGPVDQNKMDAMNQQGLSNHQLGIMDGPDAIPYDQQIAVKNEASGVKANRILAADYDKTFKRLAAINNAGQSPAAQVAAKAAGGVGAFLSSALAFFGTKNPATTIAAGTVGENVGSATGETFKDYFERERGAVIGPMARRMGISEAELNKILPSWQDNDNSMGAAYNSGIDKLRGSDAETKTPGLDQYKLKTPFPNLKYQAPKVEKPTTSKSSAPKQTEPKQIGPNSWYGTPEAQ
jgi:hypothetical protein